VIFVVGGEVNTLSEIRRGEKREKLRGKVIHGTVEMNVEVASDNEFMRCGGCKRQERTEVFEKSGEWLRMSGRRRRTIDVEHRYLRPSQLESDGS